jgi:hypothetical protein
MKFVIEKSSEPFRFEEADNYEVLYDEQLDKYGLLLDGVLFTFLTKDEANFFKILSKDKEKFEDFFNSVGIGDTKLNPQPKAACRDDYVRPTGYLEENRMKKLNEYDSKAEFLILRDSPSIPAGTDIFRYFSSVLGQPVWDPYDFETDLPIYSKSRKEVLLILNKLRDKSSVFIVERGNSADWTADEFIEEFGDLLEERVLRENTLDRFVTKITQALRLVRDPAFHEAAAEIDELYGEGAISDFDTVYDVFVAHGIENSNVARRFFGFKLY